MNNIEAQPLKGAEWNAAIEAAASLIEKQRFMTLNPCEEGADRRVRDMKNNAAYLSKAIRALSSTPSQQYVAEPVQAPCGSRDYCSRFPFCGCGEEPAFPERDATKPDEQQGLFSKFDVRRVDGSDKPGGKHAGCRYFVLDLNHDTHAPAAMLAYADSCAETHSQLAADLRKEFAAPSPKKGR